MNEDKTSTSKELGKVLLADNNTALVGYQESLTPMTMTSLKEDFLSGAIMITSEKDQEKLQVLQEKHKGVRFITPEEAMALIKGQELASFKGKETRQLLSELKKQAYEITSLPMQMVFIVMVKPNVEIKERIKTKETLLFMNF